MEWFFSNSRYSHNSWRTLSDCDVLLTTLTLTLVVLLCYVLLSAPVLSDFMIQWSQIVLLREGNGFFTISQVACNFYQQKESFMVTLFMANLNVSQQCYNVGHWNNCGIYLHTTWRVRFARTSFAPYPVDFVPSFMQKIVNKHQKVFTTSTKMLSKATILKLDNVQFSCSGLHLNKDIGNVTKTLTSQFC